MDERLLLENSTVCQVVDAKMVHRRGCSAVWSGGSVGESWLTGDRLPPPWKCGSHEAEFNWSRSDSGLFRVSVALPFRRWGAM